MKQLNMYKWVILSILTVGVLMSCGGDSDSDLNTEEIDDYATDTSISVTGNPSAITPVSVEIICKANITQGGTASYELGVLYSSNSEQLAEFRGNKVKTKDLVGNAYKVTLSSLQPNTTYYYRSYVTTGGINNYGKVKSFTTQSVASPITLQADTITAFSAYLHGKREISRESATEYGISCNDGFVISEEKDNMENKGRFISADSHYYKSFPNGMYRIIVNGLQPYTTYYYKAYSKINGGYTFGDVKSFATGEFSKPIVSTPTEITFETASVSVITADLSNYTLNSIGVHYATDAAKLETNYNTSTSNTITGTQHPVSLKGLIPNTIYYMRPFVSINSGNQTQQVYGETVTFTTANFPPPTSIVNEVTYNRVSITVNTPQTSLYKMVGVQYSLKKDDISNGEIVYNQNYTRETSTSIIVSGLSEQTTYYYRPVFYALKGYYEDYGRYDNVYGEVKTFVTTEAPPRQTMTITTAGAYGWNTYNNTSYSNCLKSNNNGIANSTARSILSFTVNMSCSLTFGYKVSSERYYDKMSIKVDNNIICDGISGSTSTSLNSMTLEKGDHTITLEYTKNNSGNSYDDCGYIYNIAINGELLSNDDFK